MGRLLVVSFCVCAFAGVAQADWATSASTITELTDGDFADDINIPENISAIGTLGILTFSKTNVSGDPATVVVDAVFSQLQTQLTVILYTGTVNGAFLLGVDFVDSSQMTAAVWVGDPVTGALSSDARNVFNFNLDGAGDYGLLDLGYTGSYDTISMIFAFDSLGDRLDLDAVENPEPMTLILFGLGGLATGGYGMRRRRKQQREAARARTGS